MPRPVETQPFVALLRGINVGKAKRVPMATLREILADLGYLDVATLLNSGNAVFRAPGRNAASHAKAICAALADRLSIDVPVIVVAGTTLRAIVAENPFAVPDDAHSRVLVAFVQDPADRRKLASIEPLLGRRERFAIGPHAAYLDCADGILESKAAVALLGQRGGAVTTRNWGTTLKLADLLGTA